MFELSKANLASTGYKLRRQISKAIMKRSGAIRSALDKYNKLAVSQNPQCPTLQYSEVMSYAALDEFEILKRSRHDILAKPWSNGIHREMTNKYFKIIYTRLAAELWLLYNRQHRINDVHRNCLARIYRLPGYTGCIPLQVSTVVTSSENEEEYDPIQPQDFLAVPSLDITLFTTSSHPPVPAITDAITGISRILQD
ncbi:hypothetical protein P692DRAFT_201841820 [Suillus brevipes Sb2]|nr:hypothetical protein P692DRAFT_201841820 [Suillus brevipes Sb2]